MQPQEVTDAKMVFPGNIKDLIPKDIPKDYPNRAKWEQLQNQWFHKGVEGIDITPKPGIGLKAACRHLQCIQGSYSIKHELKIAAFSYLASLWFEDWRMV